MKVLDILNERKLGLAEWFPIVKACEVHAEKHLGKAKLYNAITDFETDYEFVWYSDFLSLGKTKIY